MILVTIIFLKNLTYQVLLSSVSEDYIWISCFFVSCSSCSFSSYFSSAVFHIPILRFFEKYFFQSFKWKLLLKLVDSVTTLQNHPSNLKPLV